MSALSFLAKHCSYGFAAIALERVVMGAMPGGIFTLVSIPGLVRGVFSLELLLVPWPGRDSKGEEAHAYVRAGREGGEARASEGKRGRERVMAGKGARRGREGGVGRGMKGGMEGGRGRDKREERGRHNSCQAAAIASLTRNI